MNEQRQQDYLNLIQALLDCPHGEEVNILNAHPHLVDEGLVQVMGQVAEIMTQQGNENIARFLTDGAQEIAAYLGNASSTAPPEEYILFLAEVVQATADSNGDAEVVYPILTANQDKLNDTLVTLYQKLSSTIFSKIVPEHSQSFAVVYGNFSKLIQQFSLGNIASNLEIAIIGYELVLSVFTRDKFPQEWAIVQNNFGTAYSNRLKGDKAKNLETAIHCYQKALLECTRDKFPQDWAMLQNSLGRIYEDRLEGDKAENLEIVIKCYQEALLECTHNKFPLDWVRTQISLGNAYLNRLKGDKAENLETAIACYQQILREEISTQFSEIWAIAQGVLGNAYSQRLKGDKAENLEKAIEYLQLALQVITKDNFPPDWAGTQYYLGNAYQIRLLGDEAENLEKAIACYELALQVCTKDNFPKNWAMTQNSLGIAYSNRFKGNKTENLETAIACYELALQVKAQDKFPQDWVNTQCNLGNAYQERILGDKAENLERARNCYELALLECKNDNFSQDWGTLQNELGNIYLYKITGDKAENLEKAISCYKLALQVRTKDNFPQDWAATQNNLGNVYRERVVGDKAENLEKAIACCQLALQVRTKDNFPKGWATNQHTLGNAYCERVLGDKAENWEKAIACYELALLERTQDNFPQDWAATQNNLGIAYQERILGNKAENLERAIACHTLALRERTQDKFPEDWAMTQNSLGNDYWKRLKGDKAENLEMAIACWRSALTINTPTTFPLHCLIAGNNLGNAAFTAGKWEIAIEGYKQAIDAVEESRTQALNDKRRQEIITEAVGVYSDIVQAYINLGQIDKAIEYADRSRSKRLVDLMASNDLYAGGEIPPQVQQYLQQHDTLQAQIDAERERLQAESDSSKQQTDKPTDKGSLALARATREAATQTIIELEAQKQQVWEQMRRLDPILAGEIKVTPLDFATIQKLIDSPKIAILNFFTTNNDTHIFIIYKNQSPQLHTCTGFGYQTLRELVIDEWLNPYLNKKNDGGIWYAKISEFLQKIAEKLQLTTLVEKHLTNIEELIIIPHLFWHQIPFAALPLTRPTQNNSQPPEIQPSGIIRQVIEIFTRLEKKNNTINNISTIPPETEIMSTQYLGDKFRLRYVPSCQILQYCQQRPPLDKINYGTVENADGTLSGAGFEGEKIAQLYNIPQNQRLRGITQATVKNYRQLANQVQVLHSSHHASSRLDSPLESRLILADGNITLGQIMTPGFRLPNLSDVFLSCCETNLSVVGISDDILSLSTGFLCAGARSVVSTLWSVDDLATALFSISYYRYRRQGKSRSEALQTAQNNLRNLKLAKVKADLASDFQLINEARQAARDKLKKADINSVIYQQLQDDVINFTTISDAIYNFQTKRLPSYGQQEYPFADPFYWAGFICSGLA